MAMTAIQASNPPAATTPTLAPVDNPDHQVESDDDVVAVAGELAATAAVVGDTVGCDANGKATMCVG